MPRVKGEPGLFSLLKLNTEGDQRLLLQTALKRVGATRKCTYLNSNCDYFIFFFQPRGHVFQLEVAGIFSATLLRG